MRRYDEAIALHGGQRDWLVAGPIAAAGARTKANCGFGMRACVNNVDVRGELPGQDVCYWLYAQ